MLGRQLLQYCLKFPIAKILPEMLVNKCHLNPIKTIAIHYCHRNIMHLVGTHKNSGMLPVEDSRSFLGLTLRHTVCPTVFYEKHFFSQENRFFFFPAVWRVTNFRKSKFSRARGFKMQTQTLARPQSDLSRPSQIGHMTQ